MKRTFLVGCPRSGTTLLQSLLASHSNVVSFPETHLLSETIPIHRFGQLFKIYSGRTIRILEQRLIQLGLEKERIQHPTKIIFKTSEWIKVILANIDQIAEQNSQSAETHWLEKTPRHLQYADLIQKADPNVRFIHIIRRGKDVVPSLYFATRENPEEWSGARSISKCVFWWNRSVGLSARYIGDQCHLHVSYEQVVEDPDHILEVICHFLELEYEREITKKYYETAESLIQKSETWKARNTRSEIISSSKLDRLTEEDRIYIKKHLFDFPYEKIKL